jgi:hypothetical protein
MKSLLKARCCSIINTTTPPEKAHRDNSNAIVKGCTVMLKKGYTRRQNDLEIKPNKIP